MLDRGVLLRVWAARRQVALVGSGHRSCADSEARRATRADGGTGSEVSEGRAAVAEKAAWRWVAWLPYYSLCWNLTMLSSPKPLYTVSQQ